jgi:hypothetical protein
MESHGHAMIAGTGGNDTSLSFVGRQRKQAIERTAFFKGTGHLEILELAKYPLAGHVAESFGVRKRREINLIGDSYARFFDVDESDHGQQKLD